MRTFKKPRPFSSPLEAKAPARGFEAPEGKPGGATSTEAGGGESRALLDPMERCLAELVRYFRHSSAGRRVSGIIHQINTPSQVLSFQLEMLEQKNLEEQAYLSACPPAAAGKLEALRKYRLEKLRQCRQELDKLQTLARRWRQQGLHEDQEEQVYLDLNQVYLEELELYLAQPFFKHRVEKEFRFQTLPPILGHYLDFSQSFRNLVDNALEAMEGQPRRQLTVETLCKDGMRLLRIGDTGAGIHPALMPHLFEPFFTTKGTAAKPRAGLGLFLARRLLAPHRGLIQVASGDGETWVTVALPVRPQD